MRAVLGARRRGVVTCGAKWCDRARAGEEALRSVGGRERMQRKRSEVGQPGEPSARRPGCCELRRWGASGDGSGGGVGG